MTVSEIQAAWGDRAGLRALVTGLSLVVLRGSSVMLP